MRITQRDLENKVRRLNRTAGFDNPPYSTIGSYCLDYAYGGVKLEKYCTEGGGVHDIFNQGFMTKRKLYNLMSAYENGIRDSEYLI